MTITQRLALLVLFLLVPAASFLVYSDRHARDVIQVEVVGTAASLARHVAADHEQTVAGLGDLMTALAEHDSAQFWDWNSCQEWLRDVGPRLTRGLLLAATDPRGTVRCATDPGALGRAMGAQPAVRQALDGGAFAQGGVATAEGRPMIPMAMPVRHLGRVVGSVYAAVYLDELGRRMAGRALPEGTVTWISDRSGRIIAAANVPDAAPGRNLPGPLAEALAGGPEGTVDLGLDGASYRVAFRPAADGAAVVAVGVDLGRATRLLDNSLRNDLLFGASALLAFLAAGGYYGRRHIADPVRALAAAVAARSAGDPFPAAPTGRGPAEIRSLAAAFGVLIAAVDDREARLTAALSAAEEANRSKARLVASLSHDLRQPLQTAVLLAQAVARRAGPGVGDRVDRLSRALGLMSEIADGLVELTSLESGRVVPKMQAVAAADLFREIEASHAGRVRAKGLGWSAAAEDAPLRTDHVLLARMLGNIVDNAVAATRHGAVAVEGRREGDGYLVTVTDTGPGIPEAERERVFDALYQIGNDARTPGRGLGLGLPVVRLIGRLLGHEVAVADREGGGTVFSVRIPLVRAEIRRAGPRTVLVVEGDAGARTYMADELIRRGWAVMGAASGPEARDLAGRAMPDAVIAHLALPGPWDGARAVAEIRGVLSADLPAVVLADRSDPAAAALRGREDLRLLDMPVSWGVIEAGLGAAPAAAAG